MRKFAVIIITALLFSISGCQLLHTGTQDTPQVSASGSPSAEPFPSANPTPSPSEDGAPETSFSHFLHPDATQPPSAEPSTGPNAEEAQIAEYNGSRLSSQNDKQYADTTAVAADFDGNGKNDVLDINVSRDYPQSDEMNYPVKITLTINGKSAEYENTWNDGVALGIADFDTGDKYIDIYIISVGTDVSARVATFRYDGKKLYQYLDFSITEDSKFQYDTQGHIYYLGEYDGNFGVKVYVDYATGDIYTVD